MRQTGYIIYFNATPTASLRSVNDFGTNAKLASNPQITRSRLAPCVSGIALISVTYAGDGVVAPYLLLIVLWGGF